MLDVVIVGAGRMGREHAAVAKASGDRIAAVLDADFERASRLASECNAVAAIVTGDLAESLKVLDIAPAYSPVVIATPSALHCAQAVSALGQGFPVLLEKPPWVPGQDPSSLLEAESKGGILAVGMTTRFSPGVRALRQAVLSGEVGDVLWVSDLIAFAPPGWASGGWYFDPSQSGGGVLVTNGVHSLDRIAWILGSPLSLQVARRSAEYLGTCEDTAFLELASGDSIVTVTELWNPGALPASRLMVVGTSGSGWTDPMGNWTVTSTQGTNSGTAPAGHTNLSAQWRAFRCAVLHREWDDALPSGVDLVPTMVILGQVMDRPSVWESESHTEKAG